MAQEFTPEEKISKAKIDLKDSHPFFTYLVFNGDFISDPERCQNRIGISNKGEIFYSPTFIDEQTDPTIRGLIVHEVLHLATLDLDKGTREIRKAIVDKIDAPAFFKVQLINIAADIVVNALIVDGEGCNFGQTLDLPKDGYTPNLDFSITVFEEDKDNDIPELIIKDTINKSTEQVLREIVEFILKHNIDQKMKDQLEDLLRGISDDLIEILTSEGGGDSEEDEDGGKGDQEQQCRLEELSDKWKHKLAQAIQAASQVAGNIPSGLKRKANFMFSEKINWKAFVKNFVRDELRKHTTWKRPSRRSDTAGLYLPAKKYPKKVNIAVSIDASRSVNDRELELFKGHILTMCRTFKQLNLTVFSHDIRVYDESVLDVNEGNYKALYEYKPVGCGGTNLVAPFEWVQKNRPDASLILLTDGYAARPNPGDFSINHLWVVTSGGISLDQFKTGQKVKFDTKDGI